MQCAGCGAPITAQSQALGACHYCQMAIVREAPRAPSLEGAIAELLHAAGQQGSSSVVVHGTTTFVIEGKSYANLDDMPPDVRARNAEKLAKLEKLGLIPPRRR